MLTSNSKSSSCLNLWSARITGISNSSLQTEIWKFTQSPRNCLKCLGYHLLEQLGCSRLCLLDPEILWHGLLFMLLSQTRMIIILIYSTVYWGWHSTSLFILGTQEYLYEFWISPEGRHGGMVTGGPELPLLRSVLISGAWPCWVLLLTAFFIFTSTSFLQERKAAELQAKGLRWNQSWCARWYCPLTLPGSVNQSINNQSINQSSQALLQSHTGLSFSLFCDHNFILGFIVIW